MKIALESLKIVAMQAACGWLVLVAIHFLGWMFRVPVTAEFAAVGLLIGAGFYGHLREKKYPFSLSENVHALSLRVAFSQMLIALLLVAAYAGSQGWLSIPISHIHRERIFVLTMIAMGATLPISYILTRLGLWVSIRRVIQARASGG